MATGLLRALVLASLLPLPASARPPAAEVPLPPGALKFGGCVGPLPYTEGEDIPEHARKLMAWREARPDAYGRTPLPTDIRLVPDTAPQAVLHLVFDEDRSVWPTMTAMIAGASPHGKVILHVRDASERLRAEWMLSTFGKSTSKVATTAPPERIWLRDFGGFPAKTASGPVRLDFGYTPDCELDDAWPASVGPVVRVPLWLEGGSMLTDGERCYIAEVVAEDNAMTYAQVADALAPLGCEETVWLQTMPESITHVDPFLALGDSGPDGRPVFVLSDVDKTVDAEMHAVLAENARRLAPYGEVLRITIPAERPILPQLNVLAFNGVVFVPDLGEGVDEATMHTLQQAWPARTLITVPSAGVAELEGGPHCMSATEPVF